MGETCNVLVIGYWNTWNFNKHILQNEMALTYIKHTTFVNTLSGHEASEPVRVGVDVETSLTINICIKPFPMT